MNMNEKQYNIYDGAHGLDPEIEYEVIDSFWLQLRRKKYSLKRRNLSL